MSEEDIPNKKTSTVPLKKETVRITLRAHSEESGPVAPKGSTDPILPKGSTDPIVPDGATAPIAPKGSTDPLPPGVSQASVNALGPTAPVSTPPPSGAPLPPPPPPPPGVPGMSPPSAADVAGPNLPPAAGNKTIALQPTVPVQTTPPSGAKTIPLAAAGTAAVSPIGAKTIPLGQAPKPGGPSGRSTVPLGGGPQPLPQATVKMGSTQAMGSGGISQAPNIQSTAARDEEEWEEESADAGMLPFAIISLLLAIAVLAIQILTMTASGI